MPSHTKKHSATKSNTHASKPHAVPAAHAAKASSGHKPNQRHHGAAAKPHRHPEVIADVELDEHRTGADAASSLEGDDTEPQAALSPEEQVTATQALARISPRAMALREDEIIPYRAMPALAIVNVRKTKFALQHFRADMAGALPKLDLTRYDSLEDTALALVAAANDADKVSSDGEIHKNLAKARELRARLLPVLHGLAVNEHVPMKAYDDIAAGSGMRDIAKDCVDLPAAFRKYQATLTGKHPISDEDLAAADAVGTWLLRNLGTKGARSQKGAPSDAVNLRNRVATLLVRDYDDASVIAHYFLREGYAEVCPPLRSRFVSRRAVGPTPGPEPTRVPAPSPTPVPAPVASPPVAAPPPPAPSTPTNGATPPATTGTGSASPADKPAPIA